MHHNTKRILKMFRIRLIREFLELVILKYLIEQNRVSGYDLMRQINEDYGVLLSPGTIYSKLYTLEGKGLIKEEWTKKRREYIITQKGRLAISEFLNDPVGKKFLNLLEKSMETYIKTLTVQKMRCD